MKINIKKSCYAIVFSIIVLAAFGIMVKTLCRYRGKYHYYRDQANCAMSNVNYVLSCYGDPYIVDFKGTIEHPKVSIILPVYNKGWCVEAALRSLQRQTLKEIEIICVDDGSTDDSVEKIKKYQQHDTRIKLVKNGKNRGLVYTRAHGIREAHGDYIMFLDPDDLYATNDIVEVAYNKCIELDVDVVCFGGYMSRKDSLQMSRFGNKMQLGAVCDDSEHFFLNAYKYCWNKCGKKTSWMCVLDMLSDDIIEKHINYLDDWLFNRALSLCLSKFMHLDHLGYFYNLNEQSICMEPFVGLSFERCNKRANDIVSVDNGILALSQHMQDFLFRHLEWRIKNKYLLAPYTDEQLQKIYDIYMQINFDDEHKAKLSECLKDGMEEMRKLRDGDQQK